MISYKNLDIKNAKVHVDERILAYAKRIEMEMEADEGIREASFRYIERLAKQEKKGE